MLARSRLIVKGVLVGAYLLYVVLVSVLCLFVFFQKILRVNSSYYNTKSKLVCHQQNIAPLVTYIQIEQELS